MSWLFITLLLLPIIFIAVARNEGRRSTLRSETVGLEIDEFGVRRELADGRREGIDWTDLQEVEVLTARSGPHKSAGGVIILAGDELRGCLVPLDRAADSGLIDGLMRLPGFDLNLFAEAMQQKPPTRTTCWRRTS